MTQHTDYLDFWAAREMARDVHIKLDLHTAMLEGLRQTQLEQERQMDGGFAGLRNDMHDLRAEVRELHSKTATGMAQIVALIKNLERN